MRTERFPPDGKRIPVTAREVVDAWRARTDKILAQFAVGTAQHESTFTLNEIDTEDSGFVSKGIYQLSEGEALEVGLAGTDLCSLKGATDVFASLCEKRLLAIVRAAKLDLPDIRLPPDVWPYLGIAHNQGLGACVKTIEAHGMAWDLYKARNIGSARRILMEARLEDVHDARARLDWWMKVASYGDDLITGGPSWTPDLES